LQASFGTALEADLMLSALEKLSDEDREIAFQISRTGR
jgi:hypothetical protein